MGNESMTARAPVPPQAVELITRFESLRLEPYRDSGGVLTVGWGHTGKGTLQPSLTEEEALAYLIEDLEEALGAVRRHVTVPLDENQLSALVSFTFNLGEGNLRKSTLLRLLNGGDYAGAAGEFYKWHKVRKGYELQPSFGLMRRRGAEEQLFLSQPTGSTQIVAVSGQDAVKVLTGDDTIAALPERAEMNVIIVGNIVPLWQPDEDAQGGGLVA